MKPFTSSPESARCPRCARAFDCGMHAQPFDCWCREMPVLQEERLDADKRCLCPECLAAEIARIVQPGPGAGPS